MKTNILYPGSNAMLEIHLEKGENIKAESGAMVSKSANISLDGKMEGGFLGGVARLFAGEKFFFENLTADQGSGRVLLAPAIPGDITLLELDGQQEYILQKDAFFAASEGIEITTTIQDITKGLFSGQGFFILKAKGKGTLAISSFGAIHEIELEPGEEHVIDNGHLVAWPATTSYVVDKAAKGWFSSFTSGEGFVCKFTGPGKIYLQSRNPEAFKKWVRPTISAPGISSGSSASGTTSDSVS